MSRILIVDDELSMRAILSMALESEAMTVVQASSAEEALETLRRADSFDAMVTDVRMPGLSGLDLVKRARKLRPNLECIVMTAYADASTGVEAMRNGAFEYVTKPFEMDEMILLIQSALEKVRLREEVAELRVRESGRYRLDRIIGTSQAMQEVIKQAKLVAKRDTTVLLRGKSGTGKELLARGIHSESGREAFFAVSCAGLPENLLASELFGHEAGAFAGAHAQKIGILEYSGSGTLFLDEVGDIPPSLQIKLLRVLQEREFTRTGGTRVVHTHSRIIAATRRNLEEEVAKGDFREDLYFRLNIYPIFVPALAERMEDIPALTDAFLNKFGHTSGMQAGVLTMLLEYSWPGGVRELENYLERAAIAAEAGPVEIQHLPEQVRQKRVLNRPTPFRLPETGISLDELERSLILQALEMTAENKTKAAGLLGISRRALYSRMHTHNIRGRGDEEGPS